jgi:hypothetical protein
MKAHRSQWNPVPDDEKSRFIAMWNEGRTYKELYAEFGVEPYVRAKRFGLAKRPSEILLFQRRGGEQTKWKSMEDEIVLDLTTQSVRRQDIAEILRRTVKAVAAREVIIGAPRRPHICIDCSRSLAGRVFQTKRCFYCAAVKNWERHDKYFGMKSYEDMGADERKGDRSDMFSDSIYGGDLEGFYLASDFDTGEAHDMAAGSWGIE